MTEVFVGDDLLELAKAKELASVMGGAWHANEEDWDADSDSEQRSPVPSSSSKPPPTPVKPSKSDISAGGGGGGGGGLARSHGGGSRSVPGSTGGGLLDLITPLRRTLSEYRRKNSGGSGSGDHGGVSGGRGFSGRDGSEGSSAHSASTGSANGGGGAGGGGGGGDGRDKASGSGSTLSRHSSGRGSGGGGGVRRPANGKAPGRRDPEAVARLEAAAKLAAEEIDLEGCDPSWRLPTNVDYYTDRAALLRELVKEMPADKRLSFQTRVANARTKEAVESLLEDYAERLECLALPHARSREIDLQQVKKDTARERVVLDGKEMAFWGSPSDKPHTWHEELWAKVEARVTDGLLRVASPADAAGTGGAPATTEASGEEAGGVEKLSASASAAPAPVVIDKARALASEEWNKARAVATTSEVFKAMSRTGAGGDAYFALVALFCTADKLVVPVHCQESPISVEFLNEQQQQQQQPKPGKDAGKPKGRGSGGGGGGGGGGGVGGKSGGGGGASEERPPRSAPARRKTIGGERGGGDDVHVLVTVPSTFDIYLREGRPYESSKAGGGRGGRGAGSVGGHRNGGSGGGGGGGGASAIGAHGGADVSVAVHLVRVKAVVEEEIWVVGSKRPQSSSFSRAGGSAGGGSSSNSGAGAGGASGRGGGGGGGRGSPQGDEDTPALRFLLSHHRDGRRGSLSASGADGAGWGRQQSLGQLGGAGGGGSARGLGGGSGEVGGDFSSMAAAPPPLLTLTRTERRMSVAVVPELSAVSEMVRNFSRKMGVDVPSPEPPRVFGM